MFFQMIVFFIIFFVAPHFSIANNDDQISKKDEKICENLKMRKTALITGAAGFIGHHVIEVRDVEGHEA